MFHLPSIQRLLMKFSYRGISFPELYCQSTILRANHKVLFFKHISELSESSSFGWFSKIENSVSKFPKSVVIFEEKNISGQTVFFCEKKQIQILGKRLTIVSNVFFSSIPLNSPLILRLKPSVTHTLHIKNQQQKIKIK